MYVLATTHALDPFTSPFIWLLVSVMPRAQPFLAIGILSAPEFLERRLVVRATWMQLPRASDVSIMFVIRSRFAPPPLTQLLAAEQQRFNDVLELRVQWNETRFRGPVLSLALWLRHAASLDAKWIAKTDDDVYLHVPFLERFLRTQSPQRPAYLGRMAYSHFQPTRFQWRLEGTSYKYAKRLENNTDCQGGSEGKTRAPGATEVDCIGPFPVASGFLVVLSSPLNQQLIRRDCPATRRYKVARHGSTASSQRQTARGYFRGRLAWVGHLP